jgi:hypothetical protein
MQTRSKDIAWLRILLIASALGAVILRTSAQESSHSRITLLPNGTLSANIYSNDAVGVTYEFPANWTAKIDLSPRTVYLGNPNDLANRCTKVLVLLEASGKVQGRFNSIATLMAIDPACLSAKDFPQSVIETKQINKTVDKMIKAFKNSPFLPPDKVTIKADVMQGRVVVWLEGGAIINAIEGRPAPSKEPLKVNTSIKYTEWSGYWVAWAFMADDPSTEELKNVKVTLLDVPSQK